MSNPLAATAADEARVILESATYKAACEKAVQDRITKWRRETAGTDAREQHWYALQHTDEITKQLRIIADSVHMGGKK